MTDEPHTRDDDDNADLTDEALQEELTIAAYGTDDDPEREDRFDELLDEHEQREEQRTEADADPD